MQHLMLFYSIPYPIVPEMSNQSNTSLLKTAQEAANRIASEKIIELVLLEIKLIQELKFFKVSNLLDGKNHLRENVYF